MVSVIKREVCWWMIFVKCDLERSVLVDDYGKCDLERSVLVDDYGKCDVERSVLVDDFW